jgi:hypothetical protein
MNAAEAAYTGKAQITVRPVWRYSLCGNTVGFMRRSKTGQYLSNECLGACRFKLTAALGRLTAGHFNEQGNTAELALVCSNYLAANRMHWSAFLVQQVSDALGRIDNGSYGLCLRCGQSIEANRLVALPWVALCIKCQEGTSF